MSWFLIILFWIPFSALQTIPWDALISFLLLLLFLILEQLKTSFSHLMKILLSAGRACYSLVFFLKHREGMRKKDKPSCPLWARLSFLWLSPVQLMQISTRGRMLPGSAISPEVPAWELSGLFSSSCCRTVFLAQSSLAAAVKKQARHYLCLHWMQSSRATQTLMWYQQRLPQGCPPLCLSYMKLKLQSHLCCVVSKEQNVTQLSNDDA